MKKDQKIHSEQIKQTKKEYEKPQIIHTSKIETLAGSCADTSGCTPNYS